MAMLIIAAFVVGMALISRALRRRDDDGYWDRDWHSTAARPGVKFFTFADDGIRQRPRTSG